MDSSKTEQTYTIGLDFGSDSVRALIVNTNNGSEVATAVAYYPNWMNGKYCEPSKSQFRHHPKDYLNAMTIAIKEAVAQVSFDIAQSIIGIGVDTTGSTPAPVDSQGNVLALLPEFEHNPNAMFVLWKDHTSVEKADLINELAHSDRFPDYTQFVGGIYSSEWFWAKAAWVSEQDAQVAEKAHSWVELCDWIPAILSGNLHPKNLKRSVCAAGHKAMWHKNWGGLPCQDFISAISPTLDGIRDRMFDEVYTSNDIAGYLTSDWAQTLGLKPEIAVAIGAFDCHMGAVGAGAGKYDLVKVIGTSTCDILMVNAQDIEDKTVHGICGQVDGSAVPGLMALEAGQSAFGDMYAWYKRLLMWPLEQYAKQNPDSSLMVEEISNAMLPMLTEAAQEKNTRPESAIAVDWINGRRTPNANQRLKGAIANLNLGTQAPEVFGSLVESTAHGASAIVNCFLDQGIPVNRIVAIGGISKKSSYVMQTCADVIGREIAIAESEQSCALGAAIFAAVAAGQYQTTQEAQRVMSSPICHVYKPNSATSLVRAKRYQTYTQLGCEIESLTEFQSAQER